MREGLLFAELHSQDDLSKLPLQLTEQRQWFRGSAPAPQPLVRRAKIVLVLYVTAYIATAP